MIPVRSFCPLNSFHCIETGLSCNNNKKATLQVKCFSLAVHTVPSRLGNEKQSNHISLRVRFGVCGTVVARAPRADFTVDMKTFLARFAQPPKFIFLLTDDTSRSLSVATVEPGNDATYCLTHKVHRLWQCRETQRMQTRVIQNIYAQNWNMEPCVIQNMCCYRSWCF